MSIVLQQSGQEAVIGRCVVTKYEHASVSRGHRWIHPVVLLATSQKNYRNLASVSGRGLWVVYNVMCCDTSDEFVKGLGKKYQRLTFN